MTLQKAIEAAREALKNTGDATYRRIGLRDLGIDNALSSLPAKPMSEEKIMEVMIQTVTNEGVKPSTDMIMSWIRMLTFLKKAGVLYVEERE